MIRKYRDWTIESVGGHITVKRFVAEKGDKWHWAFKLKDCKEICDKRDQGIEIDPLYLRPLY